ncbi:hypothetical protein FE257_002187 [Aspergillus nanangensis]|uniref:C2H2-type domain-containing protein n=1 Tax=Aspergillus nanangensis TaxID=2582783 RepID=A0AAD4CD25_ASPNN|nr:hypothetical protein FE257_002187 [Aspergillus nanangensis]
MGLGPYLVFNGVAYECTVCDRYFSSTPALYAHCRQASQHEWCDRCCRVFISTPSKNMHLRESHQHHLCLVCPCPRDYATGQELEDHLIQSHHFCPKCGTHHQSAKQLHEHDITQHRLCVRCGDCFATDNNLQMHQQKHRPRNMACYGCSNTFKSFSGVLIHLESGHCASNVTKEAIDDIAREYYQSRKYISHERGTDGWVYKCPSCERQFATLSAVYQHAENVRRCSSPTNERGCLAQLARYIARQLQ